MLMRVIGRLVFCLMVIFNASALFAQDLKVAMLIPGKIDDKGFMQAGYTGLQQLKSQHIATSYIDNVKPELAPLTEALRRLAANQPDMIIAHGGQCGKAVETVAAEFPNIKFTVIQGNTTGKNIASYEVLQEQSAWLAGAAAGLLTKTNIVGHISGIRVPPGLKGRGAFYHGLMYTKPDAKFLTIFSGDQDNIDLARKVTTAEIDAGADIIFTMLNAGRTGAIDVMRARGIQQIGNVRDWHADYPDVFVASAVANVSLAVFDAGRDLVKGDWKAGQQIKIGLEQPDAVSLALSPNVPDAIKVKIAELGQKITSGQIKVATDYQGNEFNL